MDAAPAKQRRWFRFSLRTLLVAVSAFCVWLAMQVNAARRQHEAVTAILAAGGSVVYDFQMAPTPHTPMGFTFDSTARPIGAPWIRYLLGDDIFRDAAGVSFFYGEIGSSDFARLSDLPHLKFVHLVGTRIFPNGADMQPSRDAGCQVLGRLSQLRDVTMSMKGNDGRGLIELTQLKHLRKLSIGEINAGFAGMEHIGAIRNLEVLLLVGNGVTDAGLEHLQNLSNLEQLTLVCSAISDQGALCLTSLKRLKKLFFMGTGISSGAIRELQKSLPAATITGS